MLKIKWLCVMLGVLALAGTDLGDSKAANYYPARQYYEASWSYNSASSYHYRRYYYRPVQTYTYSYHYVIYYPAQPRYYYYYNPVTRYYWGRYDMEAKGYSMLKEEDRKERLSDIAESAFPKPSKMPGIPDATDEAQIDAPTFELPNGVK